MKAILSLGIVFLCMIMLKGQDVKMNNEIIFLLNDKETLSKLHYPKSVLKFYNKNPEYVWTASSKQSQAWAAMLLLDCAYQLGLSSSDYHLQELTFEKLKIIRDTPEKIAQTEKAGLDILMTDALISFINNLHFGRYNPSYSASYIDANSINGFYAADQLSSVRKEEDLLSLILQVQPKIQLYTDFQNYLNTLYANNNLQAHEAEIKKIIINMERLRWLNTESEVYILVNIPSYTLEFHQKKSVFHSKVIVGKPSTKSPTLESTINYFTSAPDWKVPQSIFIKEMLPKITMQYLENNHYSVYDQHGNEVEVNASKLQQIRRNPQRYSVRQSPGCDNALGAVVFRFPNSYGVYLHDTSQKQLFNKTVRALSHGCIRVEKAKELAFQLLQYDGSEDQIPVLETAMVQYKRKDFVLKQPVPLIVTYLTCLIKDGTPVFYDDIYHFDPLLENKFNLNK
ncbi:L,D-transpeptidase family protein [Chryseobacterium daecheongense]|uniref:L,D-transpeptidase n=1 Tax=Chryseobacterium daecheongense TaxID=192389 RepID=A0A3N0W4V8_9FLAO|nr:L,D-transpeptidase family protein [Chryseobacterium daecheongense]ROH99800.1 L,D-transpeptidase [Chryseobacterium daecheongense]TDX95270.1 L,D-transpeptidase-like protein [Chryseobacterium daecheongense]